MAQHKLKMQLIRLVRIVLTLCHALVCASVEQVRITLTGISREMVKKNALSNHSHSICLDHLLDF
jgi:hypothetical protein